MSPLGCVLVGTLLSLPLSFSERRIISGKSVDITQEPPSSTFVVYMIEQRDDRSKMRYQDWAWMCVGAVISSKHVLTSGACLLDIYRQKDEGKVDKNDVLLWVISGTTKYDKMDFAATDWTNKDPCVVKHKRIVTKIFYLTKYKQDFMYSPADKWVALDIGIAEVDTEFKLNVKQPECQYPVTKVDINYDEAYQKEGTDAVIFGWGSPASYRVNGENANINSDELKYASVLLMDKAKCIAEWPANFHEMITKYMVCTNGSGRLDDHGEVISGSADLTAMPGNSITIDGAVYMKECKTRRQDGDSSGTCVSDESCLCPIVDGDNTRRDDDSSPPKSIVRNGEVYWLMDKQLANARIGNKDQMITGFCQNDHGAPLVTWVGPKLKVIGVASAYLGKSNETELENNCKGPFTYMSTFCNGAFIKCVLSGKANVANDPECIPLTKHELRIVIQ